MATKKQLEEALAELIPIINKLSDVNEKYADVFKTYNRGVTIVTDDDRMDAAIELINKYSNIQDKRKK